MSGAMAPKLASLPNRYTVPLASRNAAMSNAWLGRGQHSATTASWLKQANAWARWRMTPEVVSPASVVCTAIIPAQPGAAVGAQDLGRGGVVEPARPFEHRTDVASVQRRG